MKISIIVPIYKTGYKLNRALKSIQKQTFKEFECLLIDDGSNDNKTTEICNKFCFEDARFKLYEKENEGIERTRLFGVNKASAELIMFCDHDDYYDKNAFKILYDAYLDSKADIVIANCWVQIIYPLKFTRKKIKPFIGVNTIINHSDFIENYFINFFGVNKFPVSTWGKLFKKSLFNDDIEIFNVNFMEDIMFNIQVFERAKKIHFIPDFLFTHIYGGLSSTFDFEAVINGYDKTYFYRKNHLINLNIDYKPLLIEFKNVVNEYIDYSIDNKIEKDQFEIYIKNIKGKEVFSDCLSYLNESENGDYINLIESNKIKELFNLAQSKNNLRRKVRHSIKTLVKRT